MVKKISVPDALITSIREYLKDHNLGNRGIEDGSPRKQEVGLIGELIVHHYLHNKYLNLSEKLDGFDGGYDILFKDKKIDVKTMERKSHACKHGS
jgi:hypothetical protein